MNNKRALIAVLATVVFAQQSDDEPPDMDFFAWLDSQE